MSGIFGVVGGKDISQKLFLGVDYHSHLGSEYGGIAVAREKGGLKKKIHNISQGQFKAKFFSGLDEFNGSAGIGVISDSNEQPLVFESKFGPFALCTNGLIENKDELALDLIKNGETFAEFSDGGVNPTELVATLINKGESIVDGIGKMFKQITGSVSLLLLNDDGIYAARDKDGRFPLVIGKGKDNWAIASETCAFPNLGFRINKYIAPNEIILLSKDGLKQKNKPSKKTKICSFMWIYTGFPTSNYEGINSEEVRERCGKALAKGNNVKADLVAGVPDSGVAHAIGYAIESKIPYRRPLVKYTPGYGRSYIPPSQERRDEIAFMKLIPNRTIITDKKIILCEDSIVRGTQLKNFTLVKLYNCDAKEVHVRVACPPLMFPCRFNLSTKTIEELAARKAIRKLGDDGDKIDEYLDPDSEKYTKMIEIIREELDATSLKYQHLDDMISAIGLPREKLCTYCWTGNFE